MTTRRLVSFWVGAWLGVLWLPLVISRPPYAVGDFLFVVVLIVPLWAMLWIVGAAAIYEFGND